jgi:hypothetical protein
MARVCNRYVGFELDPKMDPGVSRAPTVLLSTDQRLLNPDEH